MSESEAFAIISQYCIRRGLNHHLLPHKSALLISSRLFPFARPLTYLWILNLCVFAFPRVSKGTMTEPGSRAFLISPPRTLISLSSLIYLSPTRASDFKTKIMKNNLSLPNPRVFLRKFSFPSGVFRAGR